MVCCHNRHLNHAALWLLDFINVFLKLVCSNLCKFHAACVCKCVTRVFVEEKKKLRMFRSCQRKDLFKSLRTFLVEASSGSCWLNNGDERYGIVGFYFIKT